MLFIVLTLVFFIVFLIFMLFYLLSYKMKSDMEAMTSYECGFNLMNNARMLFSYRFFLISILFLIFDVEIVLMLSFPFLMKTMGMMVVSLLFLLILILGVVYEYYWGSLEWVSVLKI